MSNMIFTQTPAQQPTLEFHININSMQLNTLIVISSVKFINKIIYIYFLSPKSFNWKYRAILLNLSLVMAFLINVFTNLFSLHFWKLLAWSAGDGKSYRY